MMSYFKEQNTKDECKQGTSSWTNGLKEKKDAFFKTVQQKLSQQERRSEKVKNYEKTLFYRFKIFRYLSLQHMFTVNFKRNRK